MARYHLLVGRFENDWIVVELLIWFTLAANASEDHSQRRIDAEVPVKVMEPLLELGQNGPGSERFSVAVGGETTFTTAVRLLAHGAVPTE